MKQLLFPIFILILFIGCSTPRIEIPNLEERLNIYFNSNIPVRDLSGNLLNGVGYSRYATGQTRINVPFRQGVPHGKIEYFFENGQLMMRGNLKDGVYAGIREWYYENGQLRWIEFYNDGYEDGLWEGYYENGQLSWKGTYKDGEKEGLWEEYHENGKLDTTKSGFYENGVKISD
ncbi:MAG: toxin-antitoxin system YwqK family antitoxin [Balneolaceae bacterium]|nr:toxin-antitoxin system YwqK family antitoxin [Balneolaceae bacterium]